MEVIVHEETERVSASVADRIAAALEESGGRFTFGLAGGSTPIAAYRQLAGMGLDWSAADAWVSDERWVPPGHQRSNGRMAEENLLRHIEARFHRPGWAETLEPADSARRYEAVIRGIHEGRRPDLVHLGLGDDGHTASLFPGTRALEETERWIVANDVPLLGEPRITATFPLLWEARLIIVQATGPSKAEAVRGSMAGETPAGRLVEGKGRVEWHLDREAARLV